MRQGQSLSRHHDKKEQKIRNSCKPQRKTLFMFFHTHTHTHICTHTCMHVWVCVYYMHVFMHTKSLDSPLHRTELYRRTVTWWQESDKLAARWTLTQGGGRTKWFQRIRSWRRLQWREPWSGRGRWQQPASTRKVGHFISYTCVKTTQPRCMYVVCVHVCTQAI